MSARQACVHLKLEAVPGTAEASFAATDTILCRRAEIDRSPAQAVSRGGITPALSRVEPAPMAAWIASILLEFEVKCSATAGALPECDPILQSSGLAMTNPASTRVYKPDDDPIADVNRRSLSLRFSDTRDGNQHGAFGCRFGLEWEWSSGGLLICRARGIGAYIEPTAMGGAPPAVTYNAGLPFTVLKDTTPFSVHGVSGLKLKSGSFNMNAKAQERPSMGGTAANGYHAWPCDIVRGQDDAPAGSLEYEYPNTTTLDLAAKSKGAVSGALAVLWARGARELELNAASVVLQETKRTANQPIMANTPFTMHGVSEEFSWTFR